MRIILFHTLCDHNILTVSYSRPIFHFQSKKNRTIVSYSKDTEKKKESCSFVCLSRHKILVCTSRIYAIELKEWFDNIFASNVFIHEFPIIRWKSDRTWPYIHMQQYMNWSNIDTTFLLIGFLLDHQSQ